MGKAFLLVAFSIALITPALAQQQNYGGQRYQTPAAGTRKPGQQPTKVAPKLPPGTKYHRVPGEFDKQALKQKIDIPGIPEYTGKVEYLGGTVFPNSKGGPTYIMNFRCKENSAEVHAWYENSLKMYQWKIITTDPSLIQAQDKDKNFCYILVGANKDGDFKSEIQIEYRVYKAPKKGES